MIPSNPKFLESITNAIDILEETRDRLLDDATASRERRDTATNGDDRQAAIRDLAVAQASINLMDRRIDTCRRALYRHSIVAMEVNERFKAIATDFPTLTGGPT